MDEDDDFQPQISSSTTSISLPLPPPSSNSLRKIPWVEKYRPDKVNEISHQDEVISTLKSAITNGSIPHLLFYGPPGTGKTTTVLAMAKELYGPELYKTRILELNASDERGIKVVREKIKTFAQGAVGNQKSNGYPCPRFKIIILDEADTMTSDAQSALRRIMETYSKVTRFCLLCNYVTRIIEPLASRCAKFRFKTLSIQSMIARLTYIAEMEHVELEEDALNTIMTVSEGDMRKAVTYLQSAHELAGKNSSISSDIVLDVSGQIHPQLLTSLWSIISSKTTSFDTMRSCAQDIILEGYPLTDILSKLHDDVICREELSDLDKALICDKIAQADQCLIHGASEQLQFMDVCSFILRRYRGLRNSNDRISVSAADSL